MTSRQLNARERALLRKAPETPVKLGGPNAPYRTDEKVRDAARAREFKAQLVGQLAPHATGDASAAGDWGPVDLAALRSLRLWHWQHALQASKRRDDWRTSMATKALAQQSWNFHMAAVQALNDLFPMGDTAERDAAAGTSMQPLLKTRIPT